MKRKVIRKVWLVFLGSIFMLTPFFLMAGGTQEAKKTLPEKVTIEFWNGIGPPENVVRSEEHTSELQSH